MRKYFEIRIGGKRAPSRQKEGWLRMFSCKDLENFVSKSNTALQLKFVRSEADVLDDSLTFAPSFTHQVFGEREVIFGYRNLKIKLYYTPDSLETYIGLSYDEQVDPSKHEGTKPDNVLKILTEHIPPGYHTNLDEYLNRLSKPTVFRPHGDLLHVYQHQDQTYEVYKVDMSCPGFEDYHKRLQTFLLWFIDAASFIDVDDEKWTFYLVYQRALAEGKPQYSIIGYTTVYGFYAYPDKTRARISQMLILPPFQRKGHGAQLLQAVYDDLLLNPLVLDITVEDPSDEFVALRDFVDCRNAQKLESFQPPKVHQPFSKELEELCRQKLKLHKRQSRRVYEILRLRATDRSDPELYKSYRLTVKNRLNGPYQREKLDLKRLHGLVDPQELALTHPEVSCEDHMTELHKQYKEVEEEYLKVIEKLATSAET